MKTAGIIAEYNPLHNGHVYQIAQTRSLTGADYIIAVISGNFTQRGYPAMMDKYARAHMALLAGADLVLELPTAYACASAEHFALGGVCLLAGLGVVDYLSFGSECGRIEPLLDIADILAEEPPQYRRLLQDHLKNGYSFPRARSLALNHYTKDLFEDILSSPNNILGIEYCKALKRISSSIQPVTIERTGSGYHDTDLASLNHNTAPLYSSASAIRRQLNFSDAQRKDAVGGLKRHVPAETFDLLSHNYGKSFPVHEDDFSLLLKYKLLTELDNDLSQYLDVSPDLSYKIKKYLYRFESFSSFCELLKSKDITHTRISRGLLHVMLSVKTEDFYSWTRADIVSYGRILGLRRASSPLFSAIKKNASLPLVSKLADASGFLSPEAIKMLDLDVLAAHIYDSVVCEKFHQPFLSEYEKQVVTM